MAHGQIMRCTFATAVYMRGVFVHVRVRVRAYTRAGHV